MSGTIPKFNYTKQRIRSKWPHANEGVSLAYLQPDNKSDQTEDPAEEEQSDDGEDDIV